MRYACAVTALVAAALVCAGPAAARTGTDTFAGSCRFSGAVTYPGTPLTAEPQRIRMLVHLAGRCDGTLESGDRAPVPVADAPATVMVESDGTSSCAVSEQAGRGRLTVLGRTISFGFTEARTGPVATPLLTGAAGGSAVAVARISDRADAPTLVERCADGGLHDVPIDATLVTSPVLSG